MTTDPTSWRAISSTPTAPVLKNFEWIAESSATPIASAVDSVVDTFLKLTPSAVVPARISRNTVASTASTGSSSFAGIL